jgi:hypothetical protein
MDSTVGKKRIRGFLLPVPYLSLFKDHVPSGLLTFYKQRCASLISTQVSQPVLYHYPVLNLRQPSDMIRWKNQILSGFFCSCFLLADSVASRLVHVQGHLTAFYLFLKTNKGNLSILLNFWFIYYSFGPESPTQGWYGSCLSEERWFFRNRESEGRSRILDVL